MKLTMMDVRLRAHHFQNATAKLEHAMSKVLPIGTRVVVNDEGNLWSGIVEGWAVGSRCVRVRPDGGDAMEIDVRFITT